MSLIRGGRSLVSSVVRSIVRGGSEQRYFTTLNGVDAVYEMETPVVLDGAFVASGDFLFTSNGGHLFTNTLGSTNRIAISTNGELFLSRTLVGILSDTSFITDGKIHSIQIRRDLDNNVTFYVDGVILATGATDIILTINAIGGIITPQTGIQVFGGIAANASIQSESWRLDNGLGETTEQSSSGNNLLTSVNVVDADKELFTLNSDGNWLGANIFPASTYTFDGAETSGQIVQSFSVLTVGRTYEATLTVSGANPGGTTGLAGSTRALIGSTSIFASHTPVTGIVTTTSVTARWQVNGTPPFSGTAGLEVKRILQVAS